MTKKLRRLDQSRTDAQGREQQARQKHQQALQDHTGAQERLSLAHQRAAETQNALTAALQEHGFILPMSRRPTPAADREALQVKIQEYQDELKRGAKRKTAGTDVDGRSRAKRSGRARATDTARARRDAALQPMPAEQSYRSCQSARTLAAVGKQAAALRSRKALSDELALC